MRHLAGEELEEAVELVCVTAHARREPGRIGIRRLDRADLELQAVVEALDAPEHAHGIPFGKAAVEQLDVVPDPALDPPRRVDELEHEIRSALPRRAPLLAGDGVHALDGSVRCQLGDGAHGLSLGRW